MLEKYAYVSDVCICISIRKLVWSSLLIRRLGDSWLALAASLSLAINILNICFTFALAIRGMLSFSQDFHLS